MGLDENLSKGFILNLLDVHKVELKPAFAHQNEIKLLENLAAEIKEVKGETPASKAEQRRIAAEAQKNLQIAKKNQSRAMRNINAMSEKFMVFVGYTLREHYYWSRARVNHFFDNFCDVIARFNEVVVLPSPAFELVMQRTLHFSLESASENIIFVRAVLYASCITNGVFLLRIAS